MWPWMRRWHGWAMHNLWPLSRPTAQPQALYHSYERAGLSVPGQPIPWTAECVIVEALVRLPVRTGRRKADFELRLPDGQVVPAEHLRPVEGNDHYRAIFRLPTPNESTTATVLFRQHTLGQLPLPVLTRAEFLQGLRLEVPTLAVRLGNETVACQTFVSGQCKGLIATGMLSSPTSLSPLLDLDLMVEFRDERDGTTYRTPVRLTSSQLNGRTALVAVTPPRHPRRIGEWTATWQVGEHVLARQRIRGISLRHFQKSLRISDTRFVLQDGDRVRLSVQPPPAGTAERVGPCFLVASSEAGMAGLCPLQVRAVVPGSIAPPLLLDQQVLITDGPAMVAPGTLDADDLAQMSAFELCISGRVVGHLSLSTAPTATFTSEGGFRSPEAFHWTTAAEQEMTERLERLLEGDRSSE